MMIFFNVVIFKKFLIIIIFYNIKIHAGEASSIVISSHPKLSPQSPGYFYNTTEKGHSLADIQDFIVPNPKISLSIGVDETFLEVPRRIQYILRQSICKNIIDNDIQCLLYIEAFIIQLTADDYTERMAYAVLYYRSFLVELKQQEFIEYDPLTSSLYLTNVGNSTIHILRHHLKQLQSHKTYLDDDSLCFNSELCQMNDL